MGQVATVMVRLYRETEANMVGIPELVIRYKQWLRETENRDEIYKWIAVKHFQDNWDIDADDFHGMLKKTLSKSSNLMFLNSRGYIMLAAKQMPDETRELFRTLFDESKVLGDRMKDYSTGAKMMWEDLQKNREKPLTPQQDERTMAFFLAMRYPSRYYLYKDSYYRKMCKLIGEEIAKPGEKYHHFHQLADEIKADYVQTDEELIELHHKDLSEGCFAGDDTNLIVQNLLYRGLEFPGKGDQVAIADNAHWWAYAPGTNAVYWDLYSDTDVMAIGWGELGDLSGYASQDEIVTAMRELYNKPDASFKNDSLACWEFATVLKPGDVVIPKRGNYEYLGYGIVTSDYRFEPTRDDQPHVRDVRWVKTGSWPEPGGPIVIKTLTDIAKYPDYVAKLRSRIVEGIEPEPIVSEEVGINETMRHNYILYGPPGTGKTYRTVDLAMALVERRKFDSYENESREVLAQRFGQARDTGRIEFVTFHQSYSYEEFVEGIRPKVVDDSIVYEVRQGCFCKLSERARSNPTQNHVLVVDEINRGNVARIFGELITLIEDDKREGAPNQLSVQLPYSGDEFSVPNNVYVIGTMNTADRSVEALDSALRRRFSFIDTVPRPELLSRGEYAMTEVDLGALLSAINRRIERLLDRDHRIGHSYFMGISSANDPLASLREAFRDRVIPLLREYFYSDPAKVGLVLGDKFVKLANDDFAFASFDPDMAERYLDKNEYQVTEPLEWTAEAFESIYAVAED
jgi:hypothetical protein